VPKSAPVDIRLLLEHGEVQRATLPISESVKERLAYQPPVCRVFQSQYTGVSTVDEVPFDIDPEARRQLPDVIGNKAQVVVPQENADDTFVKNYTRARKIGIVFSGGPAPGGHNVIAGLYDAARRSNPESRIFGFLVGPDGIIENEYVELDDAGSTPTAIWAALP
jgi:diphosphate-dependent phosphofructokinase